jgi:putative addiction module killer protein
MSSMVELRRYARADGCEPFTEWFASLRDKVAQARILNRLLQVEAGNFGDVASVGDGVSELRVHVGAGYRVYFGQHGKAVVVLLCGGDKSHQVADVRRAKQYWLELKTRLS